MFRKVIITLSLLVVFLTSSFSQSALVDQGPEDEPTRYNIVLFIADDLGANDIGPYGNVIVRTPSIDRLAGESLLFSNAFASSPTCSPSRASILTGLMPFRNGAHANHSGIKSGIRTMPDYLRSMGYKTALAGKYHIGPRESYPFELIHHSNVPEAGKEDQGVLWTNLDMSPVKAWLSGAARSDSAFLLIVNDHSPHVIWPEVPDYEPSMVDIPVYHVDTEETRLSRARYYTDIEKMDRNLGILLESLEVNGLAEKTIVVFTSDQGPQWAFGKWNLYDYGVRVPLLIKWPAVVSGGATTDALVSLVDLLPTFVEMTGGDVPSFPEQVDGISLVPLLRGERNHSRTQVYGTRTGDGNMNRSPMRMIRTGRYKYILNLAPEIEYTTHIDLSKNHDGGRQYWDSWVDRSYETQRAAWVLWRYHHRPAEELYDVLNDPNELYNISGDPAYGKVLTRFRAQLSIWRNRQGDEENGPYTPPAGETSSEIPYIFK